MQCKNFFDNSGECVHQCNDTVREFYLHLSGSNLINSATNTDNLHTILAKMFDKKRMVRGETL